MNKHLKIKRFFQYALLFLFCCIGSYTYCAANVRGSLNKDESNIQAQKRKISGVIKDASGEPIIGASIYVNGTDIGTISDANGAFSLEAPMEGSLRISCVGYKEQQIDINNKQYFNIMLSENVKALDEVVVVGYGTEKKVNLTGSVSTINYDKEASSRPITTAAAALSGLSAGLDVMQGSGRPNGESVNVLVRGLGTLNNSNPLIMVDGTEMDISDVNPNDIASISILKDAASCAIYGNRGANGVILITTKKAKQGKVTVTYTGDFSYNTPAKIIPMVSNYADYMGFINESATNIGQSAVYSDATINQWREAAKNPRGIAASGYPNYVAYPNTNWFDWIFKKKWMQEHTVSVLGQDGRTNYNFSGTYLDNPGLIDHSGVKKYFWRANISSDITKWLQLGTRIWGYNTDQDRNDCSNLGSWSFEKLVPGMYPYYDGKYGGVETDEEDPAAGNALLTLNGLGDSYYKFNEYYTTLYANAKFLKDFSYNINMNYDYYSRNDKYTGGSHSTYSFSRNMIVQAATPLDEVPVYMYYNNFFRWKLTQLLNYNHVFNKKHDVSAMLGAEEEKDKSWWTDTEKQGVIDPNITDLSSVSDMKYINGDTQEYSSRSFFGRATYAYNSRYLFEANFRYDGSSRFAPGKRWGFFPSLSAGWRISEESFMKNTHINNLKLRASYGKLGNNSIDNYAWQSTYGSSYYPFDGTKSPGLVQTALANQNLKWEATTQTDVGLDIALLSNRFSATIDYYNKLTSGILYRPDIYLTMGNKTAPLENIAKVNNRGFEFTVGWSDKVGELRYHISGNIAYNRNKVTKYKGCLVSGWKTDGNGNKVYYSNIGDVSTGGGNRIIQGKTINEYYTLNPYRGNGKYNKSDGSLDINGGPKDGMIRTEGDMKWLQAMVNAGYTFYPNQQISKSGIWYGDYIYADTNGDGVYGNSYDATFQKCSNEPKYYYGIQASASWKGFDLSMNWAGAAGFKTYWYSIGENSSAECYGLAMGKKVAYNHYFYDPNNPKDPRTNLTSKNPRFTLNNGSDQSGSVTSSLHLYNCDFLKLKDLSIGYTLPAYISNKLFAENIRLYVSGENLLTITPFKGIDPEMRSGTGYAPLRQYAFGINITF